MTEYTLHIASLLRKYLLNKLTAGERKELDHWANSSDAHRQLFDSISDPRYMSSALQAWERYTDREIDREIAAQVPGFPFEDKIETAPVISSRITFIRRWWVAASIILVIGATIAIAVLSDRRSGYPGKEISATVDVAPGKEGAILTLADGTQMVLDSLGNGVIAREQGAQVALNNGQLIYSPTGEATDAVVYNTVHTPKGRQFSLLLPDGTQVWLNAASSIRYPTEFTDGQRRVEVSGEAYFEVARNTKMPFRASVNNKAEVEVLGTHFNVNAYENEEYINTTLLEGSIRVQADRPGPYPAEPSSVILKPGQQALVQVGEATQPAMKAQPEITVVNADIERVMAWKNGAFNFNGASLEEVMRQLQRWYDIEVIYEKGVPDIRIGGELSRDVSLAGLLKGLKESKIHFRIEEGHRLVVLP